jgi:hypothetical protein
MKPDTHPFAFTVGRTVFDIRDTRLLWLVVSAIMRLPRDVNAQVYKAVELISDAPGRCGPNIRALCHAPTDLLIWRRVYLNAELLLRDDDERILATIAHELSHAVAAWGPTVLGEERRADDAVEAWGFARSRGFDGALRGMIEIARTAYEKERTA